MSTIWHNLTKEQVADLLEMIDHPIVYEYIQRNDWLASNFIPGIKYSLSVYGAVSEKQYNVVLNTVKAAQQASLVNSEIKQLRASMDNQ